MQKGKQVINVGLNAVALICAVIVVWQFVDRRMATRGAAAQNGVRVGSRIMLPAISWQDSPKNVVLALSSYCGYCRASAPFYRSLASASQKGHFRTIAVLREPPGVGGVASALGVDGLPSNNLYHVDLETIGVKATPTLMIVDGTGTVTASWSGRLAVSQEKEVYERLEMKQMPSSIATPISEADALSPVLSGAELIAEMNSQNTVLLDTRERDIAEQTRIRGSLNMPLDEILSRAPHEISHDSTVIVYCNAMKTCNAVKDGTPSMALCAITRSALNRAGFHKLKYVTQDLASLGKKGIPVVGMTCIN